ncbi:acyltransferase [Oscillatoria sp. FACHB-1407]|nr:acyltransferase [Oscillatoria sp. FACHB-1407]
MPLQIGFALRRILYRSLFAQMGSSPYIQTGVEFTRAVYMELGDRVKVLRDVRLDCADASSKISLKNDVCLDRGVDIKAQRNCQIEIGESTYLGAYVCIAGPGSIRIGKDCLIAAQSGLFASNHTFDKLDIPIRKQEPTFKGIVIEDDCWLGTGVKVLDGVTIGKGSVIGAGAVVTKDIPPYSIAVGVPAKIVGTRTANADREPLMNVSVE